MTKEISRRAFCRLGAALGIVGPVGLPFAYQLAAINAAAAQSAPDYKALVCIFLVGGNDAHNTVLATDTDTWTRYFAARNTGSDPIALMPVGTPPAALGSPRSSTGGTVTRASPEFWGGVLPIVPKTPNPVPAGTNATVRTFALHPMLAPLIPLFTARRLAILANVGTLITPTTKAQYAAQSVPLPANLRSHNDQQATWQAGAGGAGDGWGGRMADLIYSMNGQNAIFTAISTAGNSVFLAGENVVQYQISTGATPATAVTGTTGANLFSSNLGPARLTSIIRDISATSFFENDYSAVVQRSMDAAGIINTAFAAPAATSVPAPSTFTNPVTGNTETNTLATQLQSVAKVIASNVALGMHRQVFFVTLGNFDTHNTQNQTQPDQLAKVAQAMAYFDGVLANMNGVDMRSSVTTFTASDFSRTFTTNGDGTDHAWGSNHFVMGGAVNGGDIYGQFPTLGVDQGSFTNPYMYNNQVIPAIAVEQYASTLGKWFGVSDANLDAIFPNLRNFTPRSFAIV
jgi:uncharacterized protein (DUF1501 family)